MAWNPKLKEWDDFPLIEFIRESRIANNRERIRLVGVIGRRVPHMTYPLGYKAYLASQQRFGRETWWAPHNLWRQAWHFIAGGLITIPFLQWSYIRFVPLFIGFIIFHIELLFDSQMNLKIFSKKSMLDVACWCGGSLCLVLLF